MPNFLIRGIPEYLYISLKERANKEGISLNSLILHLIEQQYIPSEITRYINAIHQDDYQLAQVIKQNTEFLEILIDELEEMRHEAP